MDVDLYEEQTEDQQAIALAKARQAWSVVKKPLLVDEIGVYFNKYHNFPGAFTKYVYKGIGLEGCYKLMNDGDQMSKQMIAVFMWGPESYKIFTIVVPGFFKKTGLQPTDKNAPFDAVFVPEGQQQTYDEIAQADFELFNRTYIRALCIRQVVDFIAKSDVL